MQKQKVMNSGLQSHMLKKQIEKHIESADVIDVESYLDDSLTLSENIGEFKRHGFIQSTVDICDEQIDRWNYENQFVCKSCGETYALDITEYADNHIMLRCRTCGGWDSFTKIDKEKPLLLEGVEHTFKRKKNCNLLKGKYGTTFIPKKKRGRKKGFKVVKPPKQLKFYVA